MICLARVVAALVRVQLATGEADEEVAPESAVVLDMGREGEPGADNALVGAVAHVEFVLAQHDILGRRTVDGGRVERRRHSDDNVDVAILRPDGCDFAWNRRDLRAVVELLRPQLKRRDIFKVRGDDDGLAGLGVCHFNAALVLSVVVGHANVESKVHHGAEDELVEGESLLHGAC